MTAQDPGFDSTDTPQPNPPRPDPPMGRFDELQFRQPRARARRTRTQRVVQRLKAWDWRWILALFVFAIALLFVLRQPLADWLWPQTRAERLRVQAAQALAAGRLTADDGSGARELYAAALALDPDRSDARAGLDRVGQAALAQARAAIARRQFDRAREALALAEGLSVPRAQADAIRELLRRNEAASVGIEELLQQAVAARAAGKLDGNGGALPLYQRVLELEPARTEALEGREDTLSDLLQQARARLGAGNLVAAAVIVRSVQQADAGHVELPDMLAALGQHAERRRRMADRALRRGNLKLALQEYGAVLLVNPEDADALRGVQSVAAAHAGRAGRLAADYRFDEAEAALQEAKKVAGASAAQIPSIADAQQHIARARQTQRQSAAAMPTVAQRRRINQLLAEAAQAQSRGDLLTPPGDSAFDKLRAAEAIAPRDPRVRAASARLLPAALDCFNAALRGNRLVRAGACLDVRRTLEGENAGVRASRSELAQRWIALGEQRLSAGELDGARGALNKARELDPEAPGLESLTRRIQALGSIPEDQRLHP